MPPSSDAMSPAKSRFLSHIFLLIAVASGFVLRVYMWESRAVVIENEGGGYARQADNLRNGRTFEGIVPGADVVETWLYPVLIAGTTLVTRNSEFATRLVSLVAGTCLIIPIYFLALRLYGRRTACIAACVVALHPLLIALSVAGYTEGLNLTLMMAAIYCALRMLDTNAGRSWLFAGIFLALAYLNRTELLAFVPLTIAATFTVTLLNKENLRNAALSSLKFLAVFAILAAPYVVFLWVHTGQFRFEGKNLVNYTIGERELAGMSPGEASRGIDENLNVTGPLLDQNRFATYSPYARTPRDILRYFLKMAGLKKYWVYRDVLTSFALGSLVLWIVAALGLFAAPWDRERFFREMFLIAVMVYFVVILLAAHATHERYTFSLLPIALSWFSRGLAALWDWAAQSVAAIQRRAILNPRMAGAAFAAIPLMLVLLSSASGTQDVNELQTARPLYLPLKRAGLWLKNQHPAPKNIFSSAVVAYYSGADQWLFPYSDGPLAVRYIRKINPDFLVIEPSAERNAPYLADWVENGIPDSQAVLVYQERSPLGVTAIYRWQKTEGSPADPAERH